MVELLAGPLVGGAVQDKLGSKNWGNLMIALDPTIMGDPCAFLRNVQIMLGRVKGARKAQGTKEIMLPGERGDRLAGVLSFSRPLVFYPICSLCKRQSCLSMLLCLLSQSFIYIFSVYHLLSIYIYISVYYHDCLQSRDWQPANLRFPSPWCKVSKTWLLLAAPPHHPSPPAPPFPMPPSPASPQKQPPSPAPLLKSPARHPAQAAQPHSLTPAAFRALQQVSPASPLSQSCPLAAAARATAAVVGCQV